MKKEKNSIQLPVKQTKAEKPVPTKESKVKPIKTVATEPKPKSATAKSTGKIEKKVELKPGADIEGISISVSERIGLTAGSIWQYLDKNGATAVVKLVRELPEDEKIIQRSIGWLAQENKITLTLIDRAETISLKE